MAKIPAMQFYVGDWMKDPNLRRCSHAAKGVWIDILCLMWESEERGVLVSSQRAWTDDEIAQAVGGDSVTSLACLHELLLKGVVQRRQDGALYSKRMVRDEHKRTLCKEAGRRGGNPTLLTSPTHNTSTLKGHSKGEVKGHVKGEITPSSSSSSSELYIDSFADGLKNLLDGQLMPERLQDQETLGAINEYCMFFFRTTGRHLDAVTLRERLKGDCGDWPAEKVRRSMAITIARSVTHMFYDPDKKPRRAKSNDRSPTAAPKQATPIT